MVTMTIVTKKNKEGKFENILEITPCLDGRFTYVYKTDNEIVKTEFSTSNIFDVDLKRIPIILIGMGVMGYVRVHKVSSVRRYSQTLFSGDI